MTSDSPPSRDPVFVKMEADMERYAQIRKEVIATARAKGTQKDLGGNSLDVPDVEETITEIHHYKIVEKTEKYIITTTDKAIQGLVAKELQAFVRKRIRPLPKAEIGAGDHDKSALQIYKMLLNYPRK